MGRGAVILIAFAACRFNFDPLATDGGPDSAIDGPISSSGFIGVADAYVKASNTGRDDHFGERIAVSADGSTLAVAAPGEDSASTGIDGNQADNTAADAGAVYVFGNVGGVWTQQAYVKSSTAAAGALFGFGLALSGDGSTLAVGAPSENADAGRVYTFTRAGTTWTQESLIDASNTDPGDGFGETVALSSDGNTLAVGAKSEDSDSDGINGNEADNSAGTSGAVYVLTRAGTTWTQQAYVKEANATPGNGFGYRVALSADGNTLVATANGEDSMQLDSGRGYVFVRNGTTWSPQAALKASNPGDSDRLGEIAIAASGDWVALSALGEDSAATGIDGNQSDDSAADAGAVYVYSRIGAAWTQSAYVKASNTNADDEFGRSVALSGDGSLLAVGASGEDSGSAMQANNAATDAGAVYVYVFESGAWSQRLYVKAPNAGSGDAFGYGAAFTQAGDGLALSAWFEDSAATGAGGDQTNNNRSDSGAVYVFR